MFRPIKIRQYVAFMQDRGFSPQRTLEGSGIREDRLADPSYLLDSRQCEAVVSNMIRLTGNQGIGFEVGSQAQLSYFGVVAQAMLSSPTLGDAVNHWLRYSNLVGMLVHLTIVEGARKEWTVIVSATQPLGFIYNFCVEEILMTGITLGAALAKDQLLVKQAMLSYPAPLHAQLYRERFGCPVQFNASRSSLTVRSPRLDQPLPGYDEELNGVYRRHCREVMRQIGSEDPLIARIRGLFMGGNGALPDLTACAERLGLSTRTLRRKLSQEGTSYQQLVNKFRMERCTDLLRAGDLSVKEIASLLGFEEVNSLRRAFKAWSDATIGQRRKQLARRAPEDDAELRERGKGRVRPGRAKARKPASRR